MRTAMTLAGGIPQTPFPVDPVMNVVARYRALPVETLTDGAGKLLLVDEKIVTEALERTLASGDLVRETFGTVSRCHKATSAPKSHF